MPAQKYTKLRKYAFFAIFSIVAPLLADSANNVERAAQADLGPSGQSQASYSTICGKELATQYRSGESSSFQEGVLQSGEGISLINMRIFQTQIGEPVKKIEKISMGATNDSYLVSSDRNYFVREGSFHYSLLFISREKERLFLRMGESLGLAPHLYVFEESSGFLVMEYVENAHYYGKIMGSWTGKKEEVLSRIIGAMQMLHAADAQEETFNYRKILDHYYHAGVAINADFPAALHEAYAESQHLSVSSRKAVPCHRDWFWGNILFNGTSLWFVDWEYADWDHPLYDLASFCIEHGLSFEERAQALDLYEGISEQGLADLHTMCRLYALKTAMWGFIQLKLKNDWAFDLKSIASSHLKSFIEGQ